MSHSHDNKRLVQTFYTVTWNTWDEATARRILHPELEFRGSIGLAVRGHDGFLGYMSVIRTAFPDFHNRIDELVAEDDKVVARLTYTGTHQGTLFDTAATGRDIAYAGAAFFRFEDGLIRNVWVLGDQLSLLRQIGAIA